MTEGPSADLCGPANHVVFLLSHLSPPAPFPARTFNKARPLAEGISRGHCQGHREGGWLAPSSRLISSTGLSGPICHFLHIFSQYSWDYPISTPYLMDLPGQMQPAFEEELKGGGRGRGTSEEAVYSLQENEKILSKLAWRFEVRVLQNARAGPPWGRRGPDQSEVGSSKVGNPAQGFTHRRLPLPCSRPRGLRDEANVLKNIKF